MEKNQSKFIDRLQFLGVIGPFILLLTLFSTLLHQSFCSWYLFVVTLAALPLSWRYQYKGFFSSVGALFLIYFSMLPVFAEGSALWQFGASVSLSLGIFTTFLGFEEIKSLINTLQLESQSRLDNLIELDQKFNVSKETWRFQENELIEELEDKSALIERKKIEVEKLEKLNQIIKKELEESEQKQQQQLIDLEDNAREISKLEKQVLQVKMQRESLQSQLDLSQSDREKISLEEVEVYQSKITDYESQIIDFNEKLSNLLTAKKKLEKDLSLKETTVINLQVALREKADQIEKSQMTIMIEQNDLKNRELEIDKLIHKLNQNEQDKLLVLEESRERASKIEMLLQDIRDKDQELNSTQNKLNDKTTEASRALEEFNLEEKRLRNSVKTTELQLKYNGEELDQLYSELQNRDNIIEVYKQNEMNARGSIESLNQKLKTQKDEFTYEMEKADKLKDKQLLELKKLNEARFARFQANMDKELLKQKQPKKNSESHKHWLMQLESLLKNNDRSKINWDKFPQDLSAEILNLKQTKQMYKKLREQFEIKNKALESAQEELDKITGLDPDDEKAIINDLDKKEGDVKALQSEVHLLYHIIDQLLSDTKDKEESLS